MSILLTEICVIAGVKTFRSQYQDMWQGEFTYPRPVSPSSSQDSKPAEDQGSETSSSESEEGGDGAMEAPDHDYLPSPSKRSRSDAAPRSSATPVVRELETPRLSERVEMDPAGKDR
jgi:hypothetical protein